MEQRIAAEFRKLKLRFFSAGIALLCACIGLSVIWNKSIKEELAGQATKFIRKGILSTDMRGVVSALNGVQFDSFESLTYFGPTGSRIITLPPTVANDGYGKMSFLEKLLYGEVETQIYLDEEQKSRLGSLSFVYSRFGLAQYAIIFGLISALLLAPVLSQSQKKLLHEIQREFATRDTFLYAEIAKKIRHDIRSPLAVLQVLFEKRPKDEQWFMEQSQNAIKRINEIVSEIDFGKNQNATPIASDSPVFEVTGTVKQIINEKKLVNPSIEISLHIESDQVLYTELDGRKLKSTISNIIDNSIQATTDSKEISITILATDDLISLKVADHGKGIPSEFLGRVFDEEFTYGKTGGSGLGLFFAKKLMDGSGGSIEIESTLGLGATLTMLFPRSPTPKWHLSTLALSEFKSVAICDDQDSIAQLWRLKLDELGFEGNIRTFRSCEEYLAEPNQVVGELVLADYDLGPGKMTGLDFIAKHVNVNEVILVTGHHDDAYIQQRCSSVGCKLMAKDQIGSVVVS